MHLHKPTLAEIPLLIEVWRRSISQATTDQHYQKQKLEAMESDPEKYLASLDDLSGGGELELEDGSKVKRLPSITRYLWSDGAPVSVISLRWQPGTTDLPKHVLGHIGYETFPWARGKGFATFALAEMLKIAKNQGLSLVEITTNFDNRNSQKVILKNGGEFIAEFEKPTSSGGGLGRRYRITL